MRQLKLITVFLSFTLLTNILFAQTYTSIDERITSYQENILINADGTIDVAEDIYYDFGPNQRHGIYREIPFLKVNSEGKKFKAEITNVQVAGDKSSVSTQNNNVVIKIGDPDKYVIGKKHYQLSYKVSGAISYFSDHDELYWNLTGNSWQVPIDQFVGNITFPFDTPYTDLKYICYTGVSGSTAENCSVYVKNVNKSVKIQVVADKKLESGEGITGVINFPKGKVAVLEPKPYHDPTWIVLLVLGNLVLASLYLHFYVLRNWWVERRNTIKKERLVAAWFEAPHFKNGDVFSPAETAALVNKKVDHRTLTSSIIYLAQKGFLKIIVGDKNEILFEKKNDWSDSKEVSKQDRALLNALFESGHVVTDKSIKRSVKFAEKVQKISKSNLSKLYEEGMFTEEPSKYLDKITAFLAISSFFMFIIAPLGIPLLLFTWIMRIKSIKKTDLGIEKFSEAKSLLNFLRSQTDQLNFQSHNQMFFEKLLPYATAFGVEKIWAKRFEDLEFAKTDWYDGPSSTPMLMIGNLNGISSSFRAITATNSSSGFSSGFSGGSSGGGGGGGGGGSW